MDSDLILVASLILGLGACGVIGKWHLIPRLNAMPRTAALMPLLHLHTFRFIGLVFLATGVVSADLAPEFAVPAAYGDLIAAALAFAALIALRRKVGFALPLVWLFNIVGVLDLLYAIFMGNRAHIAGDLGGAFFIPAVVVPALLVTHWIIFLLLLRGDTQRSEAS